MGVTLGWAGLTKACVSRKVSLTYHHGMTSLENFEHFIQDNVEKERWSHKQISGFQMERYPGFSMPSGFEATKVSTRHHELMTNYWMSPCEASRPLMVILLDLPACIWHAARVVESSA